MAKDSYLEISSHFGIYTLKQSIALRADNFVCEKVQFVGQLFMSADSQTLSLSFLFFIMYLVYDVYNNNNNN